MTNSPDEQTETPANSPQPVDRENNSRPYSTEQTEIAELFNDIEAAVNKQNGWSREAVRPLIEAWSRKQTEQVLDDILSQKVEYEVTDLELMEHRQNTPLVAVPVAAIESAQARVRKGK